MLVALEKRTRQATQALAVLGLGTLLFYAFLTLADGTLRSLANYPIEAVRDLGGLVCACAIACCFPLAFLQRANIRVRVSEMFLGRRIGPVLDTFAALAVEAGIALIAWRLYRYAAQTIEARDVTYMLRVGIGPFWLFATAMMTVTAAVQALVVVLEVARCLGNDIAGSAGREG
jgi:TRAP-type C4-dicarboxylate transport system permease small subunit